MKKKFDPFKNMQLDPYEQEIYDAIERGEFREVPNVKKEIKRITELVQASVRKDKRINIRVKNSDLDIIRARAAENGLPYQTLLSTILHQFAQGKIKITL